MPLKTEDPVRTTYRYYGRPALAAGACSRSGVGHFDMKSGPALRAKCARDFSRRCIEAICSGVGHCVHSADTHNDDERQHNCILNGSGPRFIAQEFLEVGSHGTYPGKVRPTTERKELAPWPAARRVALSIERLAYTTGVANCAGHSRRAQCSLGAGSDGWRGEMGGGRAA